MTLLEDIKNAGVVGAGGAGFPTHIKLQGQPRLVIVNGAECEPLLRVDQQLLDRERATILAALKAIARELQPEGIYLGIKDKHKQLIAKWQGIKDPDVTVIPLGDFYPAGDEHILVREVTGRTIPPGGIPLNVGVVVLNVETLYNIGRAIQGIVVTEKFVTVTGAVRAPQTLRVPIGTPIQDIIVLAEGVTEDNVAFIDGGPMMGRIINPAGYINKVTKGILVLPAELNFIKKKQADWRVIKHLAYHCEICHTCTDFCPRHQQGHPLEPHRLVRYFAYGGQKVMATDFLNSLLCVECGICETYACPVNIYPRQIVSYFKKQLTNRGVRYPANQTFVPRQPDRRVPTHRLIDRLGLKPYDRPAPLQELKVEPTKVTISLKPPFGAGCQPTIEVGQEVKTGDLIGEIPAGSLGSRVHASINGRVVAVDDNLVVIERA